ncbi:MAG TPA: WecB/TagA/CpsF family glycosyltransferase [Terracidiphilus sp.]|jgi:N-acetylglucosaminyldiphosphoundecaprenol N-acetyl-beta-D-mannosaminyltransferase|nr:WecB/TagA/CpsF family glycosyltransferase [Terracidiphilus sp.]
MDTLESGTAVQFDKVHLFGIPVANVTPEEAVECVHQFLHEDSLHHVVVVNTNKFWIANHVHGINDILKSADMIVSEYGPIWASRVLGTPLKANVRGVGLFLSLIPKFEEWGVPVYFLGAREEVLQMLLERVRRAYPRLQIAGARNGFFAASEEDKIASDIRASGAAALFVAMGSPRQEFFIEKYRNILGPRVVMGVGGSFDVLAGIKSDAPAWTHCGIEWLYRLCLDPKNLLKRYMRVHPWFVLRTLRERIRTLVRARD